MKFPNHKKGFTLVELIVAVGLFAVSVFISLGALIGLFDSNNKSQTIFSAMSNLNYAVESMTRTMRFATVYHCGDLTGTLTAPRDCGSGGDTSVSVSTPSSPVVVYRFVGSRIERSDNGNSGPWTSVTGPDVTIQYARFYVVNSAPASSPVGTIGRDNQPYVVLVIKGHSGTKPSSQTMFDIETMVSQKQLDL